MIYDNIRLLCEQKGISIRQLERDIGFGNAVISKWRKGSPSIDAAIKVADYLNVSLDSLVGRDVRRDNSPRSIPEQLRIIADQLENKK